MTFLIIPSGESYCNDRSKESAKEQRIVLRNAYAKKKEQIQKAGAETEIVYMKASKELLQKKK